MNVNLTRGTSVPMPRRTLAVIVTALVTSLALIVGLLTASRVGAFEPEYPTGPDVASWQHPGGASIDWSGVKQDGHSYTFIKATEGLGYANPFFVVDSKQAAARGLLIGSYHYARPAIDPVLQAREYAAALALQPQPSLPPVLDIEVNEGLAPAAMVAWTHSFLDELKRLTGRTPIIYTYRYFWDQQMGGSTEFTEYPLWLAAYQDTAPTVLPGGWKYMTFWQNTDSAQVTGIPGATDMNVFNGTVRQLDDVVQGNHLALDTVIAGNLSPQRIGQTAMELKTFGESNRELVGAILAVGAGVITVGALAAVARDRGLDLGPANAIVDHVRHLVASGKLPVEDLKKMAAEGKYTIGDLLILLKNAERLRSASADNR